MNIRLTKSAIILVFVFIVKKKTKNKRLRNTRIDGAEWRYRIEMTLSAIGASRRGL